MKEEYKYLTIKKLSETNGNKKRAAMKLHCTARHVNRMLKGYQTYGKAFFIHGNKGRKPAIALSAQTKQDIVDLYRTKYYGANYQHYCELLEEHEVIKVASNTIRNLLMDQNILSPCVTKRIRKELRKKLERAIDSSVSTKEKEKVKKNLQELDDPHPRKPRSAYEGELLQMDASEFDWFGGITTHLHAAIDDATGKITGAYFAEQETLNGYYNVMAQTLEIHGIPYSLLTDRRTVFEYSRKKTKNMADDTFTQFSYACSQLGISINTTSIPQTKGRVERVFQTLQTRLPIELRLKGVVTIEQANEFLKSYLKKFNNRFALQFDANKSVYEKQPDYNIINYTLAVIDKRIIDSGHCLKFKNKYYLPTDNNGRNMYFLRGTKAVVIKALDGLLYTAINDTVFRLSEVPKHLDISPELDPVVRPGKLQKQYIPPMNHPWRNFEVDKYFDPDNSTYALTFMEAAYTETSVNT